VLLLVGGCLVLGVGVGMLLTADLGSDGYSTFVNGLALTLDVPFWVVNLVVGTVLVVLAAFRGVRPGVGTSAGTDAIHSAYPGRRASDRRSISGMLAVRNSTTMASGPTTVHHHPGAAASANSQSPHQKAISPR